jgi:uncharacterized protein (TIRG00374 family)
MKESANNETRAESGTTVRGSIRSFALLALKVGISAGLVGFLLWNHPVSLPALEFSSVALLLCALAMQLVQPALVGWRWWMLLHHLGTNAARLDVIIITWISIFSNQFLPSSIGGDVVRLAVGRIRGWRIGSTLISIVLDRSFALFAILIVIAVTAPLLGGIADRYNLFWISVGPLAAITLGIMFARPILRLASALLDKIFLGPHLRSYVESLVAIASSPWLLAMVTGLAISVHLLSMGSLVLVLRAFDVDVGFGQLAAASAVVIFAQVMPISIGGWGVREAASVAVFSAISVPADVALSASILMGLGYLLASSPGGVLWLGFKRRHG